MHRLVPGCKSDPGFAGEAHSVGGSRLRNRTVTAEADHIEVETLTLLVATRSLSEL